MTPKASTCSSRPSADARHPRWGAGATVPLVALVRAAAAAASPPRRGRDGRHDGTMALSTRPDVSAEIEQFLYYEAFLLDEGRFREWLGLFTADVRYCMPTRPIRSRRPGAAERVESEVPELAYLDEDYDSLRQRVERLETGMAWAEQPASRTERLVSNVLVRPHDATRPPSAADATRPPGAAGEVGEAGAPEAAESVDVRSVLLLYRHRGAFEVEQFCGHRDDVLRREEGEWRIARRTILLAANGLPGKNLALFF
ncbi:MAG: benzene 1,2-dioxygenase [Acidimicrobiia bacterium]|nr:benzene 1,2-dioxygenase [Acidimicrobiia bacterium]